MHFATPHFWFVYVCYLYLYLKKQYYVLVLFQRVIVHITQQNIYIWVTGGLVVVTPPSDPKIVGLNPIAH